MFHGSPQPGTSEFRSACDTNCSRLLDPNHLTRSRTRCIVGCDSLQASESLRETDVDWVCHCHNNIRSYRDLRVCVRTMRCRQRDAREGYRLLTKDRFPTKLQERKVVGEDLRYQSTYPRADRFREVRESVVLVAPQGFEPRLNDSESSVLPLNEGATRLRASRMDSLTA